MHDSRRVTPSARLPGLSTRESVLFFMRTLLLMKHNLTILQVGACDGSGLIFEPLLAEAAVHVVLIEPNPVAYKRLRRAIDAASRNRGGHQIQTLNVAVCPRRASLRGVPFFVVSDRFAEDFPSAPHWMKYELGSLNMRHVLADHDPLRYFGHPPVPPSYVQRIVVPCHTPRELMRMHSIYPGEVDVLVVDAEGYDADITAAFMQPARFRPHVVVFEQKHLNKSVSKGLEGILHRKAYRLNRDFENTVAVQNSTFLAAAALLLKGSGCSSHSGLQCRRQR